MRDESLVGRMVFLVPAVFGGDVMHGKIARRLLFGCTVGMVLVWSFAVDFPGRTVAAEPDLAIVTGEFVFEAVPFKSCHAATIAESSDGLVVAWFGGDREGAENVGIWLSRFTPDGWTTPEEVATGIAEDGKRYPCWNPVLFQPSRGPLCLFFKVGPSPSRWWGMMMTSDDGGKTWARPRRLPEGILGPIKNKPLELQDGTWLCPSSRETPEAPSRWSIHFEVTGDGGQTWERITVPDGAERLDAIQPAILRTTEGRLIAVGRTRQQRIFFTASFDAGQTWSPLQRTQTPNPNSGIDATSLADGRHLLVYNPTVRGRFPLAVAISRDGVHWTPVLTLEAQPGEYSYPSLIQTRDGLVHTVYTWNRVRIRHVVLDPAKLPFLQIDMAAKPEPQVETKPAGRRATSSPKTGSAVPEGELNKSEDEAGPREDGAKRVGASKAQAGQRPEETAINSEGDIQAGRTKSSLEKRPNVIIILTDDQGYGDLSIHGNPVLFSPHIDHLAREGVRLVDFHVAPVCTPTRGQLMTGCDALRNGARSVPAATNMIWRNIPTLAEVFRKNGYRTGQFGKWHLGDHYPDRPMDRGFEKAVWFGGWGVSSDVEFDNDCLKIRYRDGDRVNIADRYCTDFWFDQALAWMTQCQQSDQPFLCYLATNAPHGPLWAQDKDAAPYRGRVKPPIASFFGMIANIDENVGRLENWLIDQGLKDDTIVIFMTDNGGTAGRPLFNAGLREGKGSYYEGGHRVPCFIRWPAGGIDGGRLIADPTQVQDILPTLIDLCGLQAIGATQFDGLSLAEILRDQDKRLPERMFVVQYGGRIRAEKYVGCVVWGNWRLVNGTELYDISRDLGQQKNLSDTCPEVLQKMRAYYESWWQQVEPTVYDYQPILVGTEQENPVILSPNYWAGVDVDNHHRVSAAEGGPRGGPFHIEVTTPGRYRIELRRWPFHCNEPLGSPGPKQTVAGRSLEDVIRTRKALPIHRAVLEVGSQALQADASPEALGVPLEVHLTAGKTTLQAWFQNANGADLCGAFYVSVEKLKQ